MKLKERRSEENIALLTFYLEGYQDWIWKNLFLFLDKSKENEFYMVEVKDKLWMYTRSYIRIFKIIEFHYSTTLCLYSRLTINRISTITTGSRRGTRHASNKKSRVKKFAHLPLAFTFIQCHFMCIAWLCSYFGRASYLIHLYVHGQYFRSRKTCAQEGEERANGREFIAQLFIMARQWRRLIYTYIHAHLYIYMYI